MTQLLTTSKMRSFRRCLREFYFYYIRLIRPVETADALAFGTLWHKGLETWWRADAAMGDSRERLELALSALRSCGSAKNEFELVKAEELLRGYHFRWASDDIRTLAVEQEFRVPLINPATGRASKTFELGGKLDVNCEQPAGNPDRQPGIYIVEHKSSGDDIGLGSVYWRQLRLDTQVSVYFEGSRSKGYDAIGCLYDVVRKPQIRPCKATPEESRKFKKDGTLYANQRAEDETPEEFRLRLRQDIAERPDDYYQRSTVVRLDSEMLDAQYDTWQTARMIAEAERLNRYPRNSDACRRYNRMCPYFDICSGMSHEGDVTRYRVAEREHEELSEGVQKKEGTE